MRYLETVGFVVLYSSFNINKWKDLVRIISVFVLLYTMRSKLRMIFICDNYEYENVELQTFGRIFGNLDCSWTLVCPIFLCSVLY